MNNRISDSRPSLIETNDFPIEFLSLLGERESWRKEVHRPIYHVHKWWAKRLGSIFRGIILGCLEKDSESFEKKYYAPQIQRNKLILDPFMGGGTTIGEAHKLGCIALGQDINPIACETVRVSLSDVNMISLNQAFNELKSTVGKKIKELYKVRDNHGVECEVLYYFWVKNLPCPSCSKSVDLFSSPIFAKNAYPKKKPEVQVCCHECGEIFVSDNNLTSANCPSCKVLVALHEGPVKGSKANCPHCDNCFSIGTEIRAFQTAPNHRLYAKLVLTPEGNKKYLRATEQDRENYDSCRLLLESEIKRGKIKLPENILESGHNTNQAIGYNYKCWKDFFNDRQLLALGWLQAAISEIQEGAVRDSLKILFSGTLEFNNLFTSYKGEGTGAVRHMFSHHVLKPERTPIEANVWGTEKSSGSFSTLYKSRILRAIDYRSSPFEISVDPDKEKIRGNSFPFVNQVNMFWPEDKKYEPGGIYVKCGSSDKLELPDKSIDFIVTDPPFFDNVHYSELADFFLAWQTLYPSGFIAKASTSRHLNEVQDKDSNSFSQKLEAVLKESARVLKDDGLLVFSYHHSRTEGWGSVIKALLGAGLSVVNAQPVKSEMSSATPKSQAKEPIQFDIIIICRKAVCDSRPIVSLQDGLLDARCRSNKQIIRLVKAGFRLSKNDEKIILFGQIIATFGASKDISIFETALAQAIIPVNPSIVSNTNLINLGNIF